MSENKTNQEYAEKWDSNSSFFNTKGYYDWMADKVKPYGTILEIGCGSGYSTLSLVNEGHKVVAVEKNSECIRLAKSLIEERGHEDSVIFIEGDILDDSVRKKIINDEKADAVICWNPGCQLTPEDIQKYKPAILEYGLPEGMIRLYPSSCYIETMLWEIGKMANSINAPFHIVDRVVSFDEDTKIFYEKLKCELGYSNFEYDLLKAETLSGKGVPLSLYGVKEESSRMQIYFLSVFYS